MELRGSRTEGNLRAAFAREAEDNRRLLYFSRRADLEGHPEVAALLRETAEGETAHALGHLEFLLELGDPVTGMPVDDLGAALRSALSTETYEHDELYPGFARAAREEGHHDVAAWFDMVAQAERRQAAELARILGLIEGTASDG